MNPCPLLPHRTKRGSDDANEGPLPFTGAGPQQHTEWLDAQENEKKVQVAEKWVAA